MYSLGAALLTASSTLSSRPGDVRNATYAVIPSPSVPATANALTAPRKGLHGAPTGAASLSPAMVSITSFNVPHNHVDPQRWLFPSPLELDLAAEPRHRRWQPAQSHHYSHSMVPGGLLVTSSTTRLTSGTSLVIRVEIRASTSYGTRVQSAVIASSEETGRTTIG